MNRHDLAQMTRGKKGRKGRPPKAVTNALTAKTPGKRGGKRTDPMTPKCKALLQSMISAPALSIPQHAKAVGYSERGAYAALQKAEVRKAFRDALIETFGFQGLPLAMRQMLRLVDGADSDRVKLEASKFVLEANGVGASRGSAGNGAAGGIRLNIILGGRGGDLMDVSALRTAPPAEGETGSWVTFGNGDPPQPMTADQPPSDAA